MGRRADALPKMYDNKIKSVCFKCLFLITLNAVLYIAFALGTVIFSWYRYLLTALMINPVFCCCLRSGCGFIEGQGTARVLYKTLYFMLQMKFNTIIIQAPFNGALLKASFLVLLSTGT